MALGGTLTEWLTLLVLVAGPGLVATVVWSPVLAVGRLRTLFRALPLTSNLLVNYVVTAMVLSVPWIVAFGWSLAEIGAQVGAGTETGKPLINVGFQLGVLYAAGLPLVAGYGLPRIGIDWDPNGYAPGTWLALVAASTWYAVIYVVPALFFGIIMSL